MLRNLAFSGPGCFTALEFDEFSLLESTRVSEVSSGEIRTFIVTPENLVSGGPASGTGGGDAAYNARLILRILQGDIRTPRGKSVLNRVGLYVGGKASNIKTADQMARRPSIRCVLAAAAVQEITHDGHRE